MRTNYDWGTTAITAVLAVILLSGWIGYNALVYSDWTCAFARCVKVSGIKP